MEEVSWADALAWWPHRPALTDEGQQHFGDGVETVAVGGDKPGRGSDPRSELTYITAFYQVPGSTLREKKMFDVLKAGGLGVWTTYVPRTHPAQPTVPNYDGARFVTVRGKQAVVEESPDQDFRMLITYEPQPTGGTITTQYFSAISKRTLEQAVDWANQLVEKP